MPREQDAGARTGLAGRLPPEVAAGLGAISRVARALNQPGSLAELTASALGELLAALTFSAAALYLPAPGRRPVLLRFGEGECAPGGPRARPELVFDEEAWRLAVASGHPVVFREEAGWLVENPFAPRARHWLALPMLAAGRLVGVVMAAREVPVELDPITLTVVTLLGDQLSAGIAAARLRQQLQRTELERERLRLAADVHDGLAQDLALAMRELALLDGDLSDDDASASRERLREAVSAAHRIVRARLLELTASAPLGGLRQALEELCERFEGRGLRVSLEVRDDHPPPAPEVAAVLLRIASEALSNAERHAHASIVEVSVGADDGSVELRVRDDGDGFEPAAAPGSSDGHMGLALMRTRAGEVAGTLDLASSLGGGTTISLRVPIDDWRPSAEAHRLEP